MKIRCLQRMFYAFMLVTSFNSYIHAMQTWNSGVGTPDVIGQNLTIDGSGGTITVNNMGNNVLVQTTGGQSSITVTLINNPVIQGNNNGDSIVFCADQAGHEILFDLTGLNDLTFQGSQNGTPLPIIIGGAGTVRFLLAGGRTVNFQAGPGNAGTKVLVFMENVSDADDDGARLVFERNSTNLSDNVLVNVGIDSLISYITPTSLGAIGATPNGTVEFNDNGSTQQGGRLVLQIADTGGVVIAPHFTTQSDKTLVTLADVDFKQSGLSSARLKITGPCQGTDCGNASSLLVVNDNKTCFEFMQDPFCTNDFDGIRYGFVLGANGNLIVGDNTYLDYVGLGLNECPCVGPLSLINGLSQVDCYHHNIHGFDCIDPQKLLKARNYSAFIIDGNQATGSTKATINFEGTGAIEFRSGVSALGVVDNGLTSACPFALNDPAALTYGAGNIVFDVEGPACVIGQSATTSKLELLSLVVDPTGGTLFVETPPSQAIFPLRTFEKQVVDGQEIDKRYNKGAFLINNCLSLFETSLQHTDNNHLVFQKNDVQSEPTYIGGETFTLKLDVNRPKIAFNNAYFRVQTDVALSGVDLNIPTNMGVDGNTPQNNTSIFKFYQNGKRVDNGTGRQMILGTSVGSTSCSGCTVISKDAHLDIIQSACSSSFAELNQNLCLRVCPNNENIVESIGTNDISNQSAVHTIYLGHASNISIGTTQSSCGTDELACARLKIQGNFFSFETRGGNKDMPALSNVTGEGGIFVDRRGKITIDCNYRANMSTMVTRSLGGEVCLPKDRVFFDCRIGIAEWQLDLNEPGADIVIPASACFSDYTLNWINVEKNYNVFCPYDFGTSSLCSCNPVLEMNITDIPTVEGSVDQFQIQGSRIGDEAHIKVDGGEIRELVFQKGTYSAQAPTAFLALQNNARVGLGTAQRNPDSVGAEFVLGLNGVTIVALESESFGQDPAAVGALKLNEDMFVSNVCAFLRGPSLGSEKQPIILRIGSNVPRELRVRSGGCLDFRQFGQDDVVEFYGQVKVILEPGAKLIMGGGELRFADSTQLFAEPYEKAVEAFYTAAESGSGNLVPSVTDSFRTKLIGTGTIRFTAESTFIVARDAFVGVETLQEVISGCPEDGTDPVECATCIIEETDLAIELTDGAQFILGVESVVDEPIGQAVSTGGSFQIGNTEDRTGHSILFTLFLNGDAAEFINKKGGFFGTAAGIADKRTEFPNEWSVGSLYNVEEITFTITQGLFDHSRIFAGDDERANLWVLGETNYSLFMEERPNATIARLNQANIAGGGNIFRLSQAAGIVNPIVGTTVEGAAGSLTRSTVLGSRIMMGQVGPVSVPVDTFFNFIQITDHATPGIPNSLGCAAQEIDSFRASRTPIRVAWLTANLIGRQSIFDIISSSDSQPQDRRQTAVDLASVSLDIQTTGGVTEVIFAQLGN